MCCGYLKACVQDFDVSDGIPSVQWVVLREVNGVAKLARGSEDVGDLITLSIKYLGIVSLIILSMACIGTWSFCYLLY
ncbi:Granulocyte colony-stimulating factor receptor [Gossypium arboreum]|uniref:Granulocyte colony-stimulating factor receptor n=1 Tax=Gossypium arboreum TaxID=29729 RepID=A0A0B0PGU1_GOSAR|nr:Granulocyte colony-stimulating factor receptor [Gossypium arboreum]